MANILNAIENLIQQPIIELKQCYKSKNRANSMGDALEEYIKDLSAGTTNITDEIKRIEKISEHFHTWEIKIIPQIAF